VSNHYHFFVPFPVASFRSGFDVAAVILIVIVGLGFGKDKQLAGLTEP